MRAPAWWRRLRAALTGYFWTPCPVCGRKFAGYEKGGGTQAGMGDAGRGWITCPRCPGHHPSRGQAVVEHRDPVPWHRPILEAIRTGERMVIRFPGRRSR